MADLTRVLLEAQLDADALDASRELALGDVALGNVLKCGRCQSFPSGYSLMFSTHVELELSPGATRSLARHELVVDGGLYTRY